MGHGPPDLSRWMSTHFLHLLLVFKDSLTAPTSNEHSPHILAHERAKQCNTQALHNFHPACGRNLGSAPKRTMRIENWGHSVKEDFSETLRGPKVSELDLSSSFPKGL